MQKLQQAAVGRSDPDSARRKPERACDRHAARLGVLGSVGVPTAPLASIGPARFAGKTRVVNGRDSRRIDPSSASRTVRPHVLAVTPA